MGKGLQAGLERLSKTVPVYQIPGSSHMHTATGEFYNRTVNKVPLFKWIDQLVDDSRPDPSSIEPTAQDLYDEMRRQSDVSTVVSGANVCVLMFLCLHVEIKRTTMWFDI